ncbi:cytochrome c oxidase subunit 2A [Aeribacillus pallidus]|jgi:hypothetical protein|nr:cytochrome c oxidase subunit 2A [Bacillus sp. (in: firmicutes)]
MAQLNVQPKKKVTTEQPEELNGTLVSVLLMGAFFIISWIIVFSIFLDRF